LARTIEGIMTATRRIAFEDLMAAARVERSVFVRGLFRSLPSIFAKWALDGIVEPLCRILAPGVLRPH
jgi:hypothetical protein